MSDKPEVIPICRSIWNTIRICENDLVEVYLRGLKAMAGIRGRVKRITDAGIVIEGEENETAIRFSEIRMIRKLKTGDK